ncbi:ribonuclease H-like domain-containing protein [Tanacetum coccineum]
MTGNKTYLAEYQDFNGGHVAFGGSKCYITGKGKIKTGKLDFKDVCFVKELQHFNLFSVSQMCDKKNKVLFTDSECLVLSPEFKLPDENQVLLRIPRQNNMYSFNLENIVPSGGLACLIAKATIDESNKWHRSKFSWVFFLRTKDETSEILKDFIRQIENQLNQKVKTIRCDNGTEFKNRDFIEFYGSKGIKREYSNARTPQQNGVAERKNRTLIEAARTMLADSFLPNTFWAEAVSTACYVFLIGLKRQEKDANDAAEALRKEFAQQTEDLLLQAGAAKPSSTNIVNTASTPVSTASTDSDLPNPDQDDSEIPALEDFIKPPTNGIFTNSSYDEGAVADFTNLETVVNVSPIPTSRINSFHPSTLILGDPQSAVQTRSKVTKSSGAHAFVSYVQKQRRNNHKDFQHCLFACFLSQNEPKKISEALEDESWVDAMQEELLQFKIQKVYRNKKDERGVVVRNKARLVAQGHRQEEGIDYDEVFAPMARIEAIRIFLAFSSYMGFIVYRMDVNSAFLYGKIDEEVTPKTSHLSVVKRIFRRLISWQCKKQTIVATSTTKAEYVAAANCCGHVLWIQNQMLDYGFNFMNTKIYIDNESTICIIKNLVYHSKTKHIAIRHHFIRDAYEKKLIQVLKIHTDDNVVDLLTKALMLVGSSSWLLLLE